MTPTPLPLQPTYDPERRVYRCPSRTRTGVSYELIALAISGFVVVSCPCEASARQLPAGKMACWHRVAVCEDLESHGLVYYDAETDRWRMTDKGDLLGAAGLGGRFTEPGPFCPGCGQRVDENTMIPIGHQAMALDGALWHRSCGQERAVRA